jgi:hypothetical protein
LYEAFEPALNARAVVLLDVPVLEQQLLGLVWRGGKIDHPGGEHDDWANACVGVAVRLSDAAYLCSWCGEPGRHLHFGNSDTGAFSSNKSPEQVQQELDEKLAEAAADSKTEIEQSIALNGTWGFWR